MTKPPVPTTTAPLGICSACFREWQEQGAAGPIYCRVCEILATPDPTIGISGGWIIVQNASKHDVERYVGGFLAEQKRATTLQ